MSKWLDTWKATALELYENLEPGESVRLKDLWKRNKHMHRADFEAAILLLIQSGAITSNTDLDTSGLSPQEIGEQSFLMLGSGGSIYGIKSLKEATQ